MKTSVYSKYRNVKTLYKGILYDSSAEAQWDARLDLLKRAGEVLKYRRQVLIEVGPQIRTRVDFQVWTPQGVHVDEIKGVETPAFKQVRRWWGVYGPAPMQICTLQNGKWKIEFLEGSRTSHEAAEDSNG